MAPSLVLRKWRRTRTPAWRWLPAASHKNGQLAHNDNSLDPMCGLCRVQGATSHITACFVFDHEEANQYIDSGQCDEYLLVHGQIRAGVQPDVTGGCRSDSTADFARVERTGRVRDRQRRGFVRLGY